MIGLADNRYSNGADRIFVQWIYAMHSKDPNLMDISRFAYAGRFKITRK